MGKWFARFKVGDFKLEDQEHSGRPSASDEDQVKILDPEKLEFIKVLLPVRPPKGQELRINVQK